MKKSILLLISGLFVLGIFAQNINITEAGGWRETAYAKWLPVENADSYNVYYTGEGITDRKIDTQLIRDYGTYFRADAVGLKAGNYTLKIAAVIDGVEQTPTTTALLPVEAHNRTGFAFMNGRVPGAYKADGTPKDNAVIIYITENTKNTISMDVTGANANPCVGLQTIFEGFKKGRDNRPLIVRMIGQITDLSYMDKGDIVIENNNNVNSYITLEGIGDDAVADGWGIRVKNATNIEIRNIGTMNCNSDEGDNIGLQQNNSYVWVHHCDFFYGDAGSASDQAKGDGALDSKTSGFVTFGYNHFWDTGKSNLLGNGTESPEYLTYHHNWYDHSDSRHPRVRSHSVHVFNNYYDGISKYGIGSTNASSVFVEGNYFRNCKYPMLISMQGSDVWNSTTQANDYNNSPTFSKENGGIIKAYNNYMVGQQRFVPYGASGFPNATVDFDAYVVQNRNDIVPSTVKAYKGASTYDNFDTNPAIMYSYTADSPTEARDKVMQYAGRMHGGDFKWTFNNAVDDTSYDVNPALKAALVNYRTKLVAVQGDGNGNGGNNGGDGGDGGNNGGNNGGGGDGSTGLIHNFTASGMASTFYTITGALSTTKGTVTYAGLTLTQCLKIESSTNIRFTVAEAGTITLVFNTGFSGRVNVNGTVHNAVNGILTLNLPAGTHTITKNDTTNLFYMSWVYTNTTSNNEIAVASFSIYPNPVRDMLHIKANDNIDQVSIYSLAGTKVYSSTQAQASYDISNLAAGTYIIKVTIGLQTQQQLLIKK